MDIRSKVEQRRAQLEGEARKVQQAEKARRQAEQEAKDAARAEVDKEGFQRFADDLQRQSPEPQVVVASLRRKMLAEKKARFVGRYPSFWFGGVLLILGFVALSQGSFPICLILLVPATLLMRRADKKAEAKARALYPYLFEAKPDGS